MEYVCQSLPCSLTGFTADVMAETIRRSSLGNCKIGSYVNLERAMAADGRFGGHIVSGHIDGTGVIRSIIQNEIIVNKLLGGAVDGLVRHGVEEENITAAWVPGAFEIPITAQKMAAVRKVRCSHLCRCSYSWRYISL